MTLGKLDNLVKVDQLKTGLSDQGPLEGLLELLYADERK